MNLGLQPRLATETLVSRRPLRARARSSLRGLEPLAKHARGEGKQTPRPRLSYFYGGADGRKQAVMVKVTGSPLRGAMGLRSEGTTCVSWVAATPASATTRTRELCPSVCAPPSCFSHKKSPKMQHNKLPHNCVWLNASHMSKTKDRVRRLGSHPGLIVPACGGKPKRAEAPWPPTGRNAHGRTPACHPSPATTRTFINSSGARCGHHSVQRHSNGRDTCQLRTKWWVSPLPTEGSQTACARAHTRTASFPAKFRQQRTLLKVERRGLPCSGHSTDWAAQVTLISLSLEAGGPVSVWTECVETWLRGSVGLTSGCVLTEEGARLSGAFLRP